MARNLPCPWTLRAFLRPKTALKPSSSRYWRRRNGELNDSFGGSSQPGQTTKSDPPSSSFQRTHTFLTSFADHLQPILAPKCVSRPNLKEKTNEYKRFSTCESTDVPVLSRTLKLSFQTLGSIPSLPCCLDNADQSSPAIEPAAREAHSQCPGSMSWHFGWFNVISASPTLLLCADLARCLLPLSLLQA